MNDFERELRKVLDGNTHFDKLSYVGRVCYGQLNDRVNAQMEFVTLGYADHYQALQVTLLDRTEGKIDVSIVRFSELWGAKRIRNNSGNTLNPHLWLSDGKLDWYLYEPTPRESEILADAVNEYLSVFEPAYGRQELAQTMDEPGMAY